MLADHPQLKLLDHLTVLRLIAIQVQYPELYWGIVRLPRALEAMEKTYSGSHTSDADYQVYARCTSPY
ncbi:MAG: hypothetical protein M3461_22665 [Pseudomonadota bacterium]|nr:hypothetical protein [Pseudomonadota bacterium]